MCVASKGFFNEGCFKLGQKDNEVSVNGNNIVETIRTLHQLMNKWRECRIDYTKK
jgi:hypothetical protein